MQIVDFTTAHTEQAMQIAMQNYNEERKYVPDLPIMENTPDLTPFAKNGLGVAVMDGHNLLGFLCCYEPFDNAFSIQGLRAVFSPMGANGTVKEKRAEIYARLYQYAGAKWMKARVKSHAICLYAHDAEARAQFNRYGFGIRTIDAIRGMDEIVMPSCDEYIISEVKPEDVLEVLPLENMLQMSNMESPFFMFQKESNESDFMEYFTRKKPTCFIAKYKNQNIAFIIAEHDGETFIQDTPGYYHVTGMYCLPEHRDKGVGQRLLNSLIQRLKTQGYTRLGVDYESSNPSGSGYWQKYFNVYTYGVVCRIDGSVAGILGEQFSWERTHSRSSRITRIINERFS